MKNLKLAGDIFGICSRISGFSPSPADDPLRNLVVCACPLRTCVWGLRKNAHTEMHAWLLPALCADLDASENDTIFGEIRVPSGCSARIAKFVDECGEGWSDGFNVTVVRNPWQRAISMYGYSEKVGYGGCRGDCALVYPTLPISTMTRAPKLMDFIRNKDIVVWNMHSGFAHVEEQIAMLFHSGTLGRLSFVGQVERLAKSLREIRRQAWRRSSNQSSRLLPQPPRPSYRNSLNPKMLARLRKEARWSPKAFDEGVRLAYPLDTAILGYTSWDEWPFKDPFKKASELNTCDAFKSIPLQPARGCELYMDKKRKTIFVQASKESFELSGLGHASVSHMPGIGGPVGKSQQIKSHAQAAKLREALKRGEIKVVAVVQNPMRRLQALHHRVCDLYARCLGFQGSFQRFFGKSLLESEAVYCMLWRLGCTKSIDAFAVQILMTNITDVWDNLIGMGLPSSIWRYDAARCFLATGTYNHIDVVLRAESLKPSTWLRKVQFMDTKRATHVNVSLISSIDTVRRWRPLPTCPSCGGALRKLYTFDSMFLTPNCYTSNASRDAKFSRERPSVCYASARARTAFSLEHF